MYVTFSFAFSSRYAKTGTSDFRKVVREHTEVMMGSIIWILLEIYFSLQQWQHFENPLRIDKVTAMSLVYYFFGRQCSNFALVLLEVGEREMGVNSESADHMKLTLYIPLCLAIAASWTGQSPLLLATHMSAPPPWSALTQSRWPRAAAQCTALLTRNTS